MTELEKSIIDKMSRIEDDAIYTECQVLQALADAYIKTVDLMEYCEDSTILEQYSIIQEAQSEESILWDDKASTFENLIALIPRLIAAIVKAIGNAIKGSDKTVKSVEDNQEIGEKIEKADPQVQEIINATEDEILQMMDEDKDLNWGKILGIGGGAVAGAGLIMHLTGMDTQLKDYVQDRVEAIYIHKTGKVHIKLDLDAYEQNLRTLSSKVTELYNASKNYNTDGTKAFKKVVKLNITNIEKPDALILDKTKEYSVEQVKEWLKNTDETLIDIKKKCTYIQTVFDNLNDGTLKGKTKALLNTELGNVRDAVGAIKQKSKDEKKLSPKEIDAEVNRIFDQEKQKGSSDTWSVKALKDAKKEAKKKFADENSKEYKDEVERLRQQNTTDAKAKIRATITKKNTKEVSKMDDDMRKVVEIVRDLSRLSFDYATKRLKIDTQMNLSMKMGGSICKNLLTADWKMMGVNIKAKFASRKITKTASMIEKLTNVLGKTGEAVAKTVGDTGRALGGSVKQMGQNAIGSVGQAAANLVGKG